MRRRSESRKCACDQGAGGQGLLLADRRSAIGEPVDPVSWGSCHRSSQTFMMVSALRGVSMDDASMYAIH